MVTGFSTALQASQRAAEIPEEQDIYGWLIGSWHLDVLRFGVDVSAHGIEGEAHFTRMLEGRGIQDVWIMPSRTSKDVRFDLVNSYGITVRFWDPVLTAWRVTWINSVNGSRDELIGRREGDRIVQIGRHADGTPIRWIFSDLTMDSFRWTGEVLQADGDTWRLEAEFRARRVTKGQDS